MAHFLLVYDRDAGRLARMETLAGRREAMQARFRAETEFHGRAGIEIVALEAESEQALMRTHGRYFLGLTALADRIADPAWRP